MRAQTVNFERGLDPKDSLEIGNKEGREFRIALRNKNYFAPVLENMINGLEQGFVSEEYAIKFTDGAIERFDKHSKLLWIDWYHDTGNNAYWNSNSGKWIISVDIPVNDLELERKIICEISQSFNKEKKFSIYKVRGFARIKSLEEDFPEDHFEKENVFYPGDELFTLMWSIKVISRVIETVIKNLG